MATTHKPRRLSTTARREQQVLKLRAKGLGFDQIAAQLGYANRSSAHKAYKRALAARGEQLTDEEARELELHRLELMHAAVWPAASRGDLAAVREAARLHTLRVRLKGWAIAPGRISAGDGHSLAESDEHGVVVGPDRLDEIRERRARDAAERTARP